MTILQTLLRYLPEKYVDAVINNMEHPSDLNDDSICFEVDFLTIFDWEESLEGYNFWEEVMECALSGEKLPNFPISIDYLPSSYIIADGCIYVMNSAGTGINLSFDIDKDRIEDMSPKAYERYYSWLN